MKMFEKIKQKSIEKLKELKNATVKKESLDNTFNKNSRKISSSLPSK